MATSTVHTPCLIHATCGLQQTQRRPHRTGREDHCTAVSGKMRELLLCPCTNHVGPVPRPYRNRCQHGGVKRPPMVLHLLLSVPHLTAGLIPITGVQVCGSNDALPPTHDTQACRAGVQHDLPSGLGYIYGMCAREPSLAMDAYA